MPSKRKRQLATLAATKKAESAKKRKVAGEAQVVVDETFSTPSLKRRGRPTGSGDSSKRKRRTVSKIIEEEGEQLAQGLQPCETEGLSGTAEKRTKRPCETANGVPVSQKFFVISAREWHCRVGYVQ